MSAPSSAAYLAALAARRSIYTLNKTLPAGVTQAKIQELVNEAVKLSPSSFNTESARVLVLFGAENDKLWDIVWQKVSAVAHFKDDAARSASHGKISNFSTGVGSVLFFEDQDVIDKVAAAYTSYATQFPIWAENSSGILQGNIWTLFALEGLGASLQHYSNLIESDVHKTWDLPTTWKLKAQMPFGGIGAPADDKVKTGKERVKIVGAESS